MAQDFVEPGIEEVDKLCSRLDKDAKQGGYNLNPDMDFVRGLVKGLLINERRYGYRACPCRLASGDKAGDLDLICPCDFMSPRPSCQANRSCLPFPREGCLQKRGRSSGKGKKQRQRYWGPILQKWHSSFPCPCGGVQSAAISVVVRGLRRSVPSAR
jgi:ferredoxin-thioredoxin reductase catalytic subunit